MVKFKPPKNKRLFIVAMIMILVGFGGLSLGVYQATISQAGESTDLPTFKPIFPKGTSISTAEGWQKLTSPEGESFYAFVDTVHGVTINVSEQKLPGKFKSNLSNEMRDMARAYNATNQLEGADGVKIYVGTSAKGPQSVLFAKDDVLVLMKSWASLSDAEWITYVNSYE